MRPPRTTGRGMTPRPVLHSDYLHLSLQPSLFYYFSIYCYSTPMLHTQIREEIKKAMLARDNVRLTTLRGVLAAFTNELVSLGRKPQDEVTDDEGIAVIRRLVKQRRDSIEQFTAGNRKDLADKEEAELAHLLPFLPATMPREEIEKLARAKQQELGITDKTKAGLLMSTLMKELKGKADGGDVKAVVDSLF